MLGLHIWQSVALEWRGIHELEPLESPVRFFLIAWQGLLPFSCPEQRVGLRENLMIFV